MMKKWTKSVNIGPFLTKIDRNRTKIWPKLAWNFALVKNRPYLTKMGILFPKLIRTSIRFENVKNLKIVYLSTTKSFLDHFFLKRKKTFVRWWEKNSARENFLLVFSDKKRDRRDKKQFPPICWIRPSSVIR